MKFKSTILKLKIHMQTLLGNVFGIRFRSLESNIEQLNKIEKNQGTKTAKPMNQTTETTSTQSSESSRS